MSEHPPEAIIGGDAHHRGAGPPKAPLDLAKVKEGRDDHRVLLARPGIPPDLPVEIFDQKRIDPERQRLGQFPAEPPEPRPPRPSPAAPGGAGPRPPPRPAPAASGAAPPPPRHEPGRRAPRQTP